MTESLHLGNSSGIMALLIILSISFRKYRGAKNKINLFTSTIKMYLLFARAIITSTARAFSVFLSSYRNTVLNQSVRIFALGCFQNTNERLVS